LVGDGDDEGGLRLAHAVALGVSHDLVDALPVEEVQRVSLASGPEAFGLVAREGRRVVVFFAEHAHGHGRARGGVVVEGLFTVPTERDHRLLRGPADVGELFRVRGTPIGGAVDADLERVDRVPTEPLLDGPQVVVGVGAGEVLGRGGRHEGRGVGPGGVGVV